MYFYVPKGTNGIALIGGGHGEVRDPGGRVVFWLNGRQRNAYSLQSRLDRMGTVGAFGMGVDPCSS